MSKPRPMTDLEQSAWDLLRDRAVGRACVIDQYDLGSRLGLSGSSKSITRRVQIITKALRDVHELPACATSRPPAGVYIPLDLDEGQEALANMFSRGWETIRSARKLRSAVLRFCGPQRPLLVTGPGSACTGPVAIGGASLCLWCADVFIVAQHDQEFCQKKRPLCRDLFWAEARRRGAEELRQELRRAS